MHRHKRAIDTARVSVVVFTTCLFDGHGSHQSKAQSLFVCSAAHIGLACSAVAFTELWWLRSTMAESKAQKRYFQAVAYQVVFACAGETRPSPPSRGLGGMPLISLGRRCPVFACPVAAVSRRGASAPAAPGWFAHGDSFLTVAHRVARFWISGKRRPSPWSLASIAFIRFASSRHCRVTADRRRLSCRSPYRLHALYTLCTPFHT